MAAHLVKVLIGPYTFPSPYNTGTYATGSIVSISSTAFASIPAGDFTGTPKVQDLGITSSGSGGGGGGGGAVSSVAGRTGAVTLTKSDVGLSSVDNTADTAKPVSSAVTTALAGKENTITAGTTGQYRRGDNSWQTLDKTAVGLANVTNTSDAAKPVSTAQQSALDAKQDLIAAGTTAQYRRGDNSWQTLNKTAVGLSNVDNTSDASKPVPTAVTDALATKLDQAVFDIHTDGTGDPHPQYTVDSDFNAHITANHPTAYAHSDFAISANPTDYPGLTLATPTIRGVAQALNQRGSPTNLSEREVTFYGPGTMSIGKFPGSWPSPNKQTFLLGNRVAVDTAPTGSDLQLSLKVNGSSIVQDNPVVRSFKFKSDNAANAINYTTTSLGVVGPTTVQEGDLLVLIIGGQNRSIAVAGWTLVNNANSDPTNVLLDASSRTYVFIKRATAIDAPLGGTAPTYAFSLKASADGTTDATGRASSCIVAVKGHYDGGSANAAFAVSVSAINSDNAGTTNTTFTMPGITPMGGGHLHLMGVSANRGSTAIDDAVLTKPAAMTLLQEGGTRSSSLIVAKENLAYQGRAATGTRVVTSTLGCRYSGVSIGIRPLRPTVRAGQTVSDFEVPPAGPYVDTFSPIVNPMNKLTVECDSFGATVAGAEVSLVARYQDVL